MLCILHVAYLYNSRAHPYSKQSQEEAVKL